LTTSRSTLYLIALLTTCGPPSPGLAVQTLLDSHAPDLRIGGRITPEAHQRYQLHVAPYMGYQDSLFTNASGLSNLMIRVDEYVDDANPHVSQGARIEAVILRVRDVSSIAALSARADAALGMPEFFCAASRTTGRVVIRYWPGARERGLRLDVRLPPVVPEDTIPGMANIPVGSGAVVFGAVPPTLGEGIVAGECPG
jgi:hypothetical protein